MNEKEKIKSKILFYCKKYNVDPPKRWTYEEVKATCEEINKRHDTAMWEKEIKKIKRSEYLRTCGNAGHDPLWD